MKTTLRQQLADSLRRYKNIYGDWYKRPYKEVTIREWNVTCEGYPTVKDLVDLCNEEGYSLKEVFLEGWSTEDYDGYLEYIVKATVKVDMSDKDWFNDVANSLSPQWEYERYKQYLDLRKEFK